ncbi:MAG: DUF1801 domain-containing protein [Bacteroidales bacterium]|nr:DUF1801 domain-containing protein [Bacteroidales bacterium]
MNTNINTIDSYISGFPKEIQVKLQTLRNVIQNVVPEATEAIKYGLPTFIYKGNLVHFGASKSHLGFYPTPSGIEAFENELQQYHTSKGTIQFPYDQPLPLELITKIIKFRVLEIQSKNKNKEIK